MGVKAGTANWLKLFNMPLVKATNEIKKIYGKVILSRSAVSWKRIEPSSNQKPGEKIKATIGDAITPANEIINRILPRLPATWLTRSCNSSRLRFSLYSVKTGTKACEKAPSANRRRMKLGILNATRKASVPPDAPKIVASVISRNKPNTRESNVMPPTVIVDRSNFLLSAVLLKVSLFLSYSAVSRWLSD